MPPRARVVVPVQPGYDATFKSRNGPVGRDMSNRATRVQRAAQAQAGVKTGMLRRDITKNWFVARRGDLGIRIGSNRPHALMHHQGTRPHVIRPRNAKVLRYVNRNGQIVFARSVNHPGTRANRYLLDNLYLAVR